MKKRIYLVPLAVSAFVLCMAVLFICQAFFADKLLPFVGYGGVFNKTTNGILWIPHYWFMLIVGAIIACLLAFWRRQQYELNVWQTITVMIFLPVEAVLGSKLLFAFENGFNFSGMSLFGGVFMTVATVPLLAIVLKKPIARMYDFIAPMGMSLIAFVRMGCFMDGCCGAAPGYVGDKYFVLPIQLFEVVLDFGVLAVLLYLEQHKLTFGEKAQKINLYNGALALVILTSYGAYRFILEFWRDTAKVHLGMSLGQVYGLIIFLFGVSILIYRKFRYDEAIEKQKRKAQINHHKK